MQITRTFFLHSMPLHCVWFIYSQHSSAIDPVVWITRLICCTFSLFNCNCLETQVKWTHTIKSSRFQLPERVHFSLVYDARKLWALPSTSAPMSFDPSVQFVRMRRLKSWQFSFACFCVLCKCAFLFWLPVQFQSKLTREHTKFTHTNTQA